MSYPPYSGYPPQQNAPLQYPSPEQPGVTPHGGGGYPGASNYAPTYGDGYPPQYGGAPPAPGFNTGDGGYPQHHEYPPLAYPAQQHPSQYAESGAGGYPGSMSAYPSQQPAGYPAPQSTGYPFQPPAAGYSSSGGYPPQQPVEYPFQQPGGYPASQPASGYPSHQPYGGGYPSQLQGSGYPSNQPSGFDGAGYVRAKVKEEEPAWMSHRTADDDNYDDGETFQQVKLKDDEFSGLIGNIASGFMKQGGGGGGGGGGSSGGGGGGSGGLGGMLSGLAGDFLKGGNKSGGGGGGYDNRGGGTSGNGSDTGGLIGGLMGGGGGGRNAGGYSDGGGGGGGGKSKGGFDVGGLIGGILGGGGSKGSSGGGGRPSTGGKRFAPGGPSEMGNILGGIMDTAGGGEGGGGGGGGSSGGGGGIGNAIGGFVKSGGKGGIGNLIGGLVSGGGGKGGGANVPKDSLKGGMIDAFSQLVGYGAHRYLGVDPATGKIIGAIAGNLLFNLGGKDNVLGNIGKIVLDNIVSGKFKRKVDPYVPPEPSAAGVPRPPPPAQPGSIQDFSNLRNDCIQRRQLFEDSKFPAEDSSLFFSQRPPKRIEWLRPGELCKDPQLFVEGHSRFDVQQGELGDCWLLAAMANLTLRDELFYRVVVPDQSFTENYAGIFHFQFWHYGKWVDVVIDDRLPTSNGRLLYLHSPSNNEYWSALVEKAYAKLHGSYEALKGGTTSEALEDFTGGLTEFIDLKAAPPNLLQMLFTAFELGSLMGCSIEADPSVFEARLRNGLVRGHAYSITGMRMVNTHNGKVPLLRIRNPWGNEQEWNGAWCDNARDWGTIPENEKRALGLSFAHDGEFWMSYDDFVRNFEKLEICNLGPEVMAEVEQMTGVQVAKTAWQTKVHDSQWIANRSAGGCRNFLKTFSTNPQFMITLNDADPNDADDLCTCVMAVLQKYRRENRSSGIDMLPIGFAIYKADGARGHLNSQFFADQKSVARSPVFINLREVCGRFRLPPGTYVMVPSTFEPNNEGHFMVRIFTNGLIDTQVV